MAETIKIADLPVAGAVTDSDVIILEQAGITKKSALDAFLASSGITRKQTLFFDTVATMRSATGLAKGMIASTRGYHKTTGYGGAEYDIWDLNDYRAAIGNPNWNPDGAFLTINGKQHYAGGDHTLPGGLVAILRYEVLWADQLGLEDPVKDEDDYIARGVNHDYGLQKAVDYAKKELSFDKSVNGEGGFQVWRNRVVHIQNGIYVKTKTCWVPANIYICGGTDWGSGAREVDFIPLKPHLGGTLDNYIRGFMFIFNGNSDINNLPDDIPPGSTPAENIYIGAYVGGWSGITLHNYETSYGTKPDGSTDWYAPNYLKGIKGAMVFGGGIFYCSAGNRMTIMYHRPGVDWDEFYADAWQIFDYRSNTPIEATDYQFDFNGSGDAVRMEQINFPVHHPPEDKTQPFPDGEYPNGVKGIILHNWASWDIRPPGEGGSQEAIAYVGAGMQIHRVVNGDIAIYGYRQVSIDACHFETGKIDLYQGSANITNTYFSKVTGSKYNAITCHTGPWGGYAAQLSLENCEFHRGFDGAHQPVEDGYYDLVINNNYSVSIKDCFQGWDTASANSEVGLKVGIITDQKDQVIIPVPGWDRWSPYLSAEAHFVRGKLVTQNREIMWNGMEGIQEVYCTPTRSSLTWDGPRGVNIYYYSQYIADVGDETTSPDFVPLGRNQRDRMVLDANGNPTNVRFEASVFLKNDEMIDDGVQPPYLTHYRPQPAFYGENETPDTGILRMYRGYNPFQYTEYIDLPLMSRAGVDDYGSTCYGRKWKTNPVPIDTNPDLNTRKRNVLPITGEVNTRYKMLIRAGYPLSDKVDLGLDYYGRPEYEYFGTGEWELSENLTIIRATNKPVMAVEEGVMNCITIYDRPFTEDVYVNLPVSGVPLWDGSRPMSFAKGTVARIVRTKDTAGPGETKLDKPLYLQVTYADGSADTVYNIGPGEIITAVYDEKDVLVNNAYVKQGQWIIVNHSPAVDTPPEFVYVEPVNSEFQILLPLGSRECFATYAFASSEELYASIPLDAPMGSKVTISRGPAQTNTLYVYINDSAGENAGEIDIPEVDATIILVRRRNGWVKDSVILNNDTLYQELGQEQYPDLTPRPGTRKMYYTYSSPIGAMVGDLAELRLEHDFNGNFQLSKGAFVKVYRGLGATYTGTLTIRVHQTRDGVVEKVLANLTALGSYVEVFYDGANWFVVGQG